MIKLQNITIIFIIIILPIVVTVSVYMNYELKTISRQNQYNTGIITATHDAVFAFEMNTKNDDYRSNPEKKRVSIKAAIKTFENSLSSDCNLGLYNTTEIEEYIPAVAFCLYDGFYMYAPYKVYEDGKLEYKNSLKNYVYYSEEIGNDIIINYTLDNYIAVSGPFGKNGKYTTRAGYLITGDEENTLNSCRGTETATDKKVDSKTGRVIPITDSTTKYIVNRGDNYQESSNQVPYWQKYLIESKEFTDWFYKNIRPKASGETQKALTISSDNDPEDTTSAFSVHKRAIMKTKIEDTLNTAIVAYSNNIGAEYKMPKFNEEEWEKVYRNVAVITLVQGLPLGFKDYNGYCILNSTNNQEYVNPDLLYFSDGTQYHDIRCSKISNKATTGYKVGSFEKVNYTRESNILSDLEAETQKLRNRTQDTSHNYYYRHDELACYDCVNGSVNRWNAEKMEKQSVHVNTLLKKHLLQ